MYLQACVQDAVYVWQCECVGAMSVMSAPADGRTETVITFNQCPYTAPAARQTPPQ